MSSGGLSQWRVLGTAPRLLLVDDDEVSSLVTAHALEQAGFELQVQHSAPAGLQALESQWFDAVLIDALMPGMDGFEMCQRLRATPQWEHLPVLMLTGLDDEPSVAKAYQAGATDFFVKSTQWNLLAGRLRYMLRSAQVRAELARSKARLARAQSLARMGPFEWVGGPRLSDGVLKLSNEALQLLGLPRGEPPSLRQVLRRVNPADRRALLQGLRESATRHSAMGGDVALRPGPDRPQVLRLEAEPEFVEGALGFCFTGVLQDFTDRRQAEDHIRQLADFDLLTGLPNRQHMRWRLERALEASQRRGHLMAVLLMDLDGFKPINDRLGHAAGDEVLKEAARRLRDTVRHTDHPHEGASREANPRSHRQYEAVARWGGDEFVALLPEIQSPDDAHRVAQRMLEAMRSPMGVAGQECWVTVSVGFAVHPLDGHSVAQLLDQADQRMYRAKAQGRNAAVGAPPSGG